MNLAKKHLSSMASKGRFGDTEMYKTSKTGPGKGELWHVNKQEKSLMDMYGQRGEKLVDHIGSGTINPKTGKEEKFLPMLSFGLSAAAFGMNIVEGSAQKQLSREQGKDQANLMREKLKTLEDSEKAIQKSADSQKKILDLESQVGFRDMTQQFSQKSIDLEEASKSAIQKSGGLVSGSATNRMNTESKKSIDNLYESATEKMTSEYGKMLGSIEGDLEVKKEQIKMEKAQTKSQMDMYDDQANQKGFFGNLGDMMLGGR